MTNLVLERVPDASAEDVRATRVRLRARTGQIEVRANKLTLSGIDRTKPITDLEREVVEKLGSGMTARQVFEACKLVRDPSTARTVCAAMAVRGAVAERPGSSPTIYEPVAVAEVAA